MQIRSIQVGASCIGLLAVAGIAYGASLSGADKQFLAIAARADMTEAHEGQIAEDRAAAPAVKDFAKTMVQDHTENYERLTVLAAQDGVPIPKGINSARDPAIRQLVHLKGPSFDRTFATDEIAAHRHAIAVFKHEAEHGQDPGVKAFAEKTIPVLEKHLQLAEACAKRAKHS
ncbi:MAG: DUF4142 domain-containing protein [Bryobacteraceae bacterium]|jgi:putative membrane protein